jgi:hypothetical protein
MVTDKNDVVLNMSRAKIMIVDDDPELRMALKLAYVPTTTRR